MNKQSTLQLAQQFLGEMGANATPEDMAALCVPDLAWNIPGNTTALPWIGAKRGSDALADFIRDGAGLMTRVNATGKQIDSHFAIVLTFAGDKVASLLMLEDSFAVSAAAHA